jgi:uncharacterized protein YprB with RNaseH-like and TPR domain
MKQRSSADTVELLTLPATALERVSQPAVRDAVQYFGPDLVTIPGPRTPRAHASVRDAAPDRPVLHPQLARGGRRCQHYRFNVDTGLHEAPDSPPPAETIDVLAIQSEDHLGRLRTQLATDERHTGSDAATFVVVPQLTVDWDAAALEATLPHAADLAALATTLPESVTIFAGGQPGDYYNEWDLQRDHTSVTVPVAGLGATNHDGSQFAQYTCTTQGRVAAEAVDPSEFGLQALTGIGEATATRLHTHGCETVDDARNRAVADLAALSGIGRSTAERIHAHADVLDSGEPLVLTNKTPVTTRDDRPPLCIDIETDGLSPTIIWQVGVYDPATDSHRSFVEKDDPTDPTPVLEAFMTWLLANHADRTLLAWNGHKFDYEYIRQFLQQYRPEYVESWEDVWTYDLYKWAVRDENALLPGRTNKLDHVARALGYESAGTGLTGAQTAAAYQAFMRNPDDPTTQPDWERHERYCEDDCRALWYVYQAILDAPRRDTTDSGTGGASGQQTGLTDF